MNFFGDLLKNGNNDALALPDVAEYRWKKPAENESEQGAGNDGVGNGQPEEQVGQEAVPSDNGATGNSGSGIEDIPLDNVEKSIRPSISDMIKHSAVKLALPLFSCHFSPSLLCHMFSPRCK